MKQISRFFMLVTLLFTLFGASNANAQAMKEILMPRWGKQVVEVSEEMLFYDYKGTGYINSSNSDNTLATIVFKPAEPGKVVQITFEDFDLRSDFGSYFGYANVYNGEVDPSNKFVYPETTSGVTSSSTLPKVKFWRNLKVSMSTKHSFQPLPTAVFLLGAYSGMANEAMDGLLVLRP